MWSYRNSDNRDAVSAGWALNPVMETRRTDRGMMSYGSATQANSVRDYTPMNAASMYNVLVSVEYWQSQVRGWVYVEPNLVDDNVPFILRNIYTPGLATAHDGVPGTEVVQSSGSSREVRGIFYPITTTVGYSSELVESAGQGDQINRAQLEQLIGSMSMRIQQAFLTAAWNALADLQFSIHSRRLCAVFNSDQQVTMILRALQEELYGNGASIPETNNIRLIVPDVVKQFGNEYVSDQAYGSRSAGFVRRTDAGVDVHWYKAMCLRQRRIRCASMAIVQPVETRNSAQLSLAIGQGQMLPLQFQHFTQNMSPDVLADIVAILQLGVAYASMTFSTRMPGIQESIGSLKADARGAFAALQALTVEPTNEAGDQKLVTDGPADYISAIVSMVSRPAANAGFADDAARDAFINLHSQFMLSKVADLAKGPDSPGYNDAVNYFRPTAAFAAANFAVPALTRARGPTYTASLLNAAGLVDEAKKARYAFARVFMSVLIPRIMDAVNALLSQNIFPGAVQMVQESMFRNYPAALLVDDAHVILYQKELKVGYEENSIQRSNMSQLTVKVATMMNHINKSLFVENAYIGHEETFMNTRRVPKVHYVLVRELTYADLLVADKVVWENLSAKKKIAAAATSIFKKYIVPIITNAQGDVNYVSGDTIALGYTFAYNTNWAAYKQPIAEGAGGMHSMFDLSDGNQCDSTVTAALLRQLYEIMLRNDIDTPEFLHTVHRSAEPLPLFVDGTEINTSTALSLHKASKTTQYTTRFERERHTRLEA
jgi:hypothetical protein